ncbi:MAG: glycosyltransferase, partial [Thermoproteota archaeon]
MIVEVLQAVNMLLYGKIHLLVLFFLVFVLAPRVVIKVKERGYRTIGDLFGGKVTAIVPVYKEEPELFKACLESIHRNGADQIIVSIDSGDRELIRIAEECGAEVISFPERVGKRRALAEAWKRAKNELIVHVDSDVVLEDGCIRELIKPFSNPEVVGVESKHRVVPGKSKMAYVLSNLIERNRVVNSRALNGGLVVVDGRCSAWRRGFLLSVADEFVNERWMGVRCEIGDDRFLSREALKRGFKTVFQETACSIIRSPDAFMDFVKQQIRWRRSGTKFWLKDLKEGVHPSLTYAFKCATYYLSPFIFPAAVILDLLLFPTQFTLWNIAAIPLVVVAGCSLTTALNQTIYFGRPLTPKYLVPQAII